MCGEWGWDGSGAHVLQADDGRTDADGSVGHFKCRSAMKGLTKKGRMRGRKEKVTGFANATEQCEDICPIIYLQSFERSSALSKIICYAVSSLLARSKMLTRNRNTMPAAVSHTIARSYDSYPISLQ